MTCAISFFIPVAFKALGWDHDEDLLQIRQYLFSQEEFATHANQHPEVWLFQTDIL